MNFDPCSAHHRVAGNGPAGKLGWRLPGGVFLLVYTLFLAFPGTLRSEPAGPCAMGCFKPTLDAAKAGSGEAENRMGVMFATGVGAPYDPRTAASWYERAARQGHAMASVNLGMLYLTGQGVAEDLQQAHHWIQIASNRGNGQASHLLGSLYELGMGVAANVEKAQELYRKAGEQGNLLARNEWTRLAKAAWPRADQVPLLAAQHSSPPEKKPPLEKKPPPGVRRSVQPPPKDLPVRATVESLADTVASTTWEMEPSTEGDRRVSSLLDKTKAAAIAGDTEAQNYLGTMYLSGFGGAPDPKEAFHWFQSAAQSGHPRAQINLASMLLTGMGTAENPVQAAQWLEKAAEQNHPEGQYLLASLYEKGKGVEKDDVKALQWYAIAAEQGQDDAKKAKDRLKSAMPANAVNLASKGMKTFLSQNKALGNQPPLVQLASLHLDSQTTPPQSTTRAKRGVSQQPQVVAAVEEKKPASLPQVPSALDRWGKNVDDKNVGNKPVVVETKDAYVPLLVLPVAKEIDAKKKQSAQDELKQAIIAEGTKDSQGVLKALTQAYALDPTNAEVAKRLGILAMDAGRSGEALSYFKAASQSAASKGNVGNVGNVAVASFANERISELVTTPPPWVEEKLTQAGAVPPEQAGVSSHWSDLLEQAMARAQEGDLDKAVALGQQALDLTRKNFGEEHAATILTLRELGNIHVQNGQLDIAEPLFQQSADLGKKVLGDTHPETLAAQTLLAELKESRVQLDDAIARYRQISESANKGFGPNDPLKLQTELALARVYKNLGNTGEGEKILRATCPLVAQTYGFTHPETATCWQQFAEILRAQGHFDRALQELQPPLSILANVLPKQDPKVVGGQITLAGLHRDLGHFPEAKKILESVLDTIKGDPVGLSFLQADARTVLSRVLLDSGELDQAQALATTLYEETKAKSGSEHPSTLTALTDLASVKEKKGLFDDAEKELNEALGGYRKVFGERHPTTITVLNNLGQMLETEGLYDNAEPLLRQAATLSEQVFGKRHPTTLTAQNNLALLHESQGNFDKAEPLYQQAIDTLSQVLGPRHSDTVAIINNLAYLYLLKEEYAKALPLFEKILAIWGETLGEGHQRSLKALNNLARTTQKLGKLKEAEALFQKALAQRSKVLGPNHMDTLRSMHDLASLYHDMGREKEAEELLKKTLSLDDQILGKHHPYTFETINTLAKVLEKGSNFEGAFQIRQEGFSRRTEFLNRMLWTAGDSAREGTIRLHRPELDSYMSSLSHLDTATAGREALDIGLKRKGILLKITSEIQQVSHLSQDPQLQATSKDLAQARKDLASLTLSGPTPETVDTHLVRIQGLEEKINNLQMQLGQHSKRFRRSIGDVVVKQLIDNLPNDSVLVDFLVFKDGNEEKLLAGLLIKNKDKAQFDFVVYPRLEAIQKAVLDYRTIIQDEEADKEDLIAMGQTVYGLIWQPIAKRIGVRQSVYLVPDGILHILPFPAMVDGQGKYITQSTDLHLLSSSRDLIPSDVPSARGQYLILAGPDYNYDQIVASSAPVSELKQRRSASLKTGLRAFSSGMRGLRFDPLPGAQKEGELISEISKTGQKGNQTYTQNAAQEKVISELTEPPEILHIATHGFFLKPDDNLRKRLLKLQRSADIQMVPPGDNPLLRSGLAFAGINTNAQFLGEMDTDNDGVLTALEVMGRDFSGTRLAVLSACETGLGEIHEGEGVYGLRRAFQEAGVQSVISSLWEVSDAGTQELMSNMYQRLNQGKSPHQALRESQLKMIDSPEWSAPYIWSAFMMVGQ